MYNSFVQICQIKTYAEFWIAWFVLTFNEYKTVDPWSGFFNWLDDTGLKHLVYLFFEGFFKVNGHWPTWSLFRCDVQINLYVVWQTRKSADTFKYIWIFW